MSYPRLIQPLVIEDDPDAHFLYDTALETMITDGLVAPAHYAFCYDDAVTQLESNTIFHLVILDLRLPEHPRLPAPQGVDLGLSLLEKCVKRDSYPIPALLVISGAIGKARQTELEDRVRSGFSYGRVLVKSGTEIEPVLREAVRNVHAYCDIGIHIQDGGEGRFPTLSPREEDLIRKCALDQEACTGVDLAWWSAEYERPTGPYSSYMGWKKILTGRFLLDGGDSTLRPYFFKFTPAAGANVIVSGAKRMELKLSHIKVRSHVVSDTRCLLVTEKVGSSKDAPISLATYLGYRSEQVGTELPKLVIEIVEQVLSLGATTVKMLPTSKLLWKSHDRARIADQWSAFGGQSLLDHYGLDCDPVGMYDALMSDPGLIRFNQMSFLHGDLNPTNIALDYSAGGYHAYIFDAEGTEAGVNVRDLAMLEVTTLLHQVTEDGGSILQRCKGLYREQVSPLDNDTGTEELDRTRNTQLLISTLREQVLSQVDPWLYALMVFDHALLQLGGLAFPLSRNKIAIPADAALLAALACKWLEQTPRPS